MKRLKKPAEDRFWAHVNLQVTGCWLWTGAEDKDGYGVFQVKVKQSIRAHRYAYILRHGPISADVLVLHTCDTPACVRDGHLFTGDHLKNVIDRHAKGRTARGERTGTSKLTDEDVLAIRARHNRGATYAGIALDYDLTAEGIALICKRKTWTHL